MFKTVEIKIINAFSLELQGKAIQRLYAGGIAYVSESRHVQLEVEPVYG
ncbi:MAG TPA: hypothetical protein PKE06_21315 [Flavilitoribacter sp.]|nr:hypothetical protein [Flavilitoribacter sp.]HMQ89403.1 hypothetical protein [Flavilitoribacter sp.]